jgi:3-dehydroquinate synthase
MIDSSVGGKTGVNFPPWGKNQVGLFHPPELVLISMPWLETLPERELKAGTAECLKHALIGDRIDLWDKLICLATNLDWSKLRELIMDLVAVKAQIVARDPFEYGERAVLNLGHTLGHALESLSLEVDGDAALKHGECVMIGLAYALKLSALKAGFQNHERFTQDIRKADLLPKVSQILLNQINRLDDFLAFDKKNQTDLEVEWVLLTAPGQFMRGPQHRGSENLWTVPLKDGFHVELFADLLR